VILRGFGAGVRGETAARGGRPIDLAADLSASDVEKIAHEIDRNLRGAVPAVDQVFLDPTGRKE
jgi:hypothetical protein